jgi:hypothetical protein
MPVFHGTNQTIDKFDEESLGSNTKAVSSYGGFFFTEDVEEAQTYADYSASRQIENAKDHEKKEAEYLEQMEVAQRKGDWDQYEKLNIEMEDFSLGAMRADPSGQRIYSVYLSIKNPFMVKNVGNKNTGEVNDLINKAREQGHDGVYLVGISDGFVRPTNQWVAFASNQIRII